MASGRGKPRPYDTRSLIGQTVFLLSDRHDDVAVAVRNRDDIRIGFFCQREFLHHDSVLVLYLQPEGIAGRSMVLYIGDEGVVAFRRIRCRGVDKKLDFHVANLLFKALHDAVYAAALKPRQKTAVTRDAR